MVSDWLKQQEKSTRINHIRAVLTTIFSKKMAAVFSKGRFDFACKTIEHFNIPNLNTVKSTSFGPNELKMWC